MDIQKTMEFILEQTAATTAQLQQFSIEMKDLKAVVAQHEDDLQTHTEWKIEMSQALQDLASQMKHGFTEVAARHGDLVQAQRELAEAHKATEESLNILIRTVQDMLPRLPKQ